MKILILGAGQVGSTVAQTLVAETNNDITVIDTDEQALDALRGRCDLGTVHGSAAYPDILKQADADNADIIIAVTNSDEVNIIACQLAHALFHTPTKIARVRASEYLSAEGIFQKGRLGIDRFISPEQLVTDYICRLLEYSGPLQVLDFANGKLRLVDVRAEPDGALVGLELRALRDHLPNTQTRVAAIYRDGKPIIPTGDTVIEANDEVFLLAARRDIRTVIRELSQLEKPFKNIILAGAGNIGIRLALALQDSVNVKLIERDEKRAQHAAAILNNSTPVLHGSAADEVLLHEENIDQMDAFLAVTNAEEANILSAMLAKQMGARKALTLINRPAFAVMVENSGVNVALSPQQVTIGALLTHIRRGDILNVHTLRANAGEAIEAIAHSTNGKSKVVGQRIDEVPLPQGATIGAIVRGNDILMGHGDIVIQDRDHVVVFVLERKHIAAVEKLFQVDVNFV